MKGEVGAFAQTCHCHRRVRLRLSITPISISGVMTYSALPSITHAHTIRKEEECGLANLASAAMRAGRKDRSTRRRLSGVRSGCLYSNIRVATRTANTEHVLLHFTASDYLYLG